MRLLLLCLLLLRAGCGSSGSTFLFFFVLRRWVVGGAYFDPTLTLTSLNLYRLLFVPSRSQLSRSLCGSLSPQYFFRWQCGIFFPTLGVGVLDFKLSHYSSPGLCLVFRHTSENPECRIQRPNASVSVECPTPEYPWRCLECPTPEYAWSAHPSVSLDCPTPKCPWRVGMFKVK